MDEQTIERVLIACPSRLDRERTCARLDASGLETRAVESVAGAASLLDAEVFDALILAPCEEALDLTRRLSDSGKGPCVALLSQSPSIDEALLALRSGASDVLSHAMPAHEFVERVRECVRKGRDLRGRAERVERLKKVCRRLDSARQQVTRQVGSLCTDLVSAYQELSTKISDVSIASEYHGLVRRELDLEGLLRTTLEFVLGRTGPTNAAVFLPTPGGDFSLGAYINYDCSREGGEVLLEHLAGVIAPRVEHEPEPVILEDAASIRGYLGEGAAWLGDAQVILLPCLHDGECLAVAALFRDRRMGFTSEMRSTIRTVADLFAAQLARVIRIHHRHLPRDKWGLIGEGGDDLDLAA